MIYRLKTERIILAVLHKRKIYVHRWQTAKKIELQKSVLQPNTEGKPLITDTVKYTESFIFPKTSANNKHLFLINRQILKQITELISLN